MFGKETMLNCPIQKLVLAALIIMFAPSGASASGAEVWSINLHKLQYNVGRTTMVRWRQQYVVVGSSKFLRDEENKRCVLAFDPDQPLLVFDVTNRKQVPTKVLDNIKNDDWEPPRAQKNFYPCEDRTRYAPSAPIITPELFYGFADYHFVVFDTDWRERYRISSPSGQSCWDICVVSNRTGTRFAILDQGQSWRAKIFNALHPINDTFYTDKKVIRVFNAQEGKKLFEYSWTEPLHSAGTEENSPGTVAFSDDGEMFAVIGDEARLQVFRIKDDNP
jgi:hypothetical protein